MARYEDYVAKQDGLQSEIDAAAQAQQDRIAENPADAIPERFKGKSAAEIAKSYAELEQAFSRQGNDMGTLRKTLDEFIKLQSDESEKPTPEARKPVDLDTLYDDPDAAIRKVVREEAGGRIEQLERELAQERFNASIAPLDGEFRGWRDRVKSPEFREWLNAAPYRLRLAIDADQNLDPAAVRDLVGLYYAENHVQTEVNRDRALRNATLETSGPASADHGPVTYSRAKIIQAKVDAKRGDPQAQAWLRANSDGIQRAYAEGHVTD